jgi:hypothetical protein
MIKRPCNNKTRAIKNKIFGSFSSPGLFWGIIPGPTLVLFWGLYQTFQDLLWGPFLAPLKISLGPPLCDPIFLSNFLCPLESLPEPLPGVDWGPSRALFGLLPPPIPRPPWGPGPVATVTTVTVTTLLRTIATQIAKQMS